MRKLFDMLNNIKLGRSNFEPKFERLTGIISNIICSGFEKINLGQKNFNLKFFCDTDMKSNKLCTVLNNIKFTFRQKIFDSKISRFTNIGHYNSCNILDFFNFDFLGRKNFVP